MPAGCTIMAASTSAKAPSRAMRILPPPPSSAGVPRTTTLPPVSPTTSASAAAAPAPAAAMMLWPQAWPMPGSASYSHRMATRGRPLPSRAANGRRQPVGAALDGEAALSR